MITRILTFCLLALSCGIVQSQETPPTIVKGSSEERVAIQSKLREIVLAIISFDSANGAPPARYTKAPDGTPLLSWRVHILPFLAEDELYNKFKLDEPWNSPHNKKLIKEMPDIYKTPSTQGNALRGRTHFVGIEHGQSVLPTPLTADNAVGTAISRFTNGASNTIAVVFGAGTAAEDAVPWTQPVDLRVSTENPFDDLVADKAGVVHCVMLDGSLQSLTKEKYENVKELTFFTTRNPATNTNPYATNGAFSADYRTGFLRQNPSVGFSSTNRHLTQTQNGVPDPRDFDRQVFSNAVPNVSGSAFGPVDRETLYVPSTRGMQSSNRFYDADRERKIRKLQNEALAADGEKTRENKLSLLKETLEQSFDESIKVQAAELETLKARVAKLNAIFEKRKSNRDRVIENHIDRIRLQAEGLTIPQDSLQTPRRNLVPVVRIRQE